MKKINKLGKLKLQVQELTVQLIDVRKDKNYYQGLLNQIETILREDKSHLDRFSFEKISTEVMRLCLFRRTNEGAYHPMREVVENQREIIRWLIKPSTAEKPSAEVINDFRKKGLI